MLSTESKFFLLRLALREQILQLRVASIREEIHLPGKERFC